MDATARQFCVARASFFSHARIFNIFNTRTLGLLQNIIKYILVLYVETKGSDSELVGKVTYKNMSCTRACTGLTVNA